MTVPMIIPVDKAIGPLPRGSEIREPLLWEDRPILRGAEQRLHEGVVVAHPWPRVDGMMPSQCNMAGTIVAFRVHARAKVGGKHNAADAHRSILEAS